MHCSGLKQEMISKKRFFLVPFIWLFYLIRVTVSGRGTIGGCTCATDQKYHETRALASAFPPCNLNPDAMPHLRLDIKRLRYPPPLMMTRRLRSVRLFLATCQFQGVGCNAGVTVSLSALPPLPRELLANRIVNLNIIRERVCKEVAETLTTRGLGEAVGKAALEV